MPTPVTTRFFARVKRLQTSGVYSADSKLPRDGEELDPRFGGEFSDKEDQPHFEDYLSNPSNDGKLKASSLVDGLLINGFAMAREIAIQTYTKQWFDAEEDLSFKSALAKELSDIFGTDGFRNTVWDTIAGKE